MIFRYIKELFILSLPITVARIGTFLIVFVDIIMIGGEGSFTFIAYSSANLINTAFWLIGISALFGVRILISQNSDKTDYGFLQAIVSEGVYFALILALCLFLLSVFSEGWITLFGYSKDISVVMAPVVTCLGFGLFGHLVYASIAFYLEATEKAKVAMWIVLFGIVLNFILNYVFITVFDDVSQANLIALATSIVRSIMCLFSIYYIVKHCGINPFLRAKEKVDRVFARKELYGHGVASIVIASMGFVSVLFSSMVEYVGIKEAAAFHIFMSLINLIANFTSGVASALSIKVGRAYSTKAYSEIKIYCFAALWICSAISILFYIILLITGEFIVMFYTSEQDVISKSVEYLIICGFIYVFCDVLNRGASGLSRGLGDKKFTTLSIVFSSLFSMLLAYLLCVLLYMESYYLFISISIFNSLSALLIVFKSIRIVDGLRYVENRSINA